MLNFIAGLVGKIAHDRIVRLKMCLLAFTVERDYSSRTPSAIRKTGYFHSTRDQLLCNHLKKIRFK